jgi:alkylation response protein AidB-like acyl-CoA dehydrogenase
MDFRFTAEEERFREEVRQFLDQELPPGWDEEFDMETEAGADALWEFARQLQRKLGQRRWLALAWPPEHGGLGAPIMHQVIFNEEMGRRRAPLLGLNMGVYWVGPAIMLYGPPGKRSASCPRSPPARRCGAPYTPSQERAPTWLASRPVPSWRETSGS